MTITEDLSRREAMRAAAALMGAARSERKAAAARENGRLGGTPRRFVACESGKWHRWLKGRCRFCGKTKRAVTLKEAKP